MKLITMIIRVKHWKPCNTYPLNSGLMYDGAFNEQNSKNVLLFLVYSN